MVTMYSTSTPLKPILIEHPTQTKHSNAASKLIWLHHDFTSHGRRGRHYEYTGCRGPNIRVSSEVKLITIEH